MPTRPARPPRTVPGWFPGGLCLPQHEVERVSFARIIWFIAAFVGEWQHLVPGKCAQFSELWPGMDIKINTSTGFVCHSSLKEPFHPSHNFWDHICCARIVIGGSHVERLHILDEMRCPAVSQFKPVLADFPGFA